MADLLIKFIIRLGNNAGFGGGPLFHRWLPQASESAIDVRVETGHLQLWFERRGYTDNNMVRFSFERHEVDDSIVQKQGKLDAGPLFGRLRITNVSSGDLDVLRHDRIGDTRYVELGKNIIESVNPVVERLSRLLRVRYGQHWLKEMQVWDSRYISLGAICTGWDMRWSDDNGSNWRSFKPDKMVRNYGPLGQTKFNEYLTQADWHDLKAAVEKRQDPSLAAQF